VAIEPDGGEKTKYELVSRTAEQPGQALNVDLCFVPAEHQVQQKLPAVSGSSGRLVVTQNRTEAGEPDHPGRVFAEAALDYVTAMTEFVTRSQAEPITASDQVDGVEAKAMDLKAQKQALRQEQAALTTHRRQVREQRRQEDEAWHQLKVARRQQPHHRAGQRAAWGSRKVEDEHRVRLRQQRRQQLQQRQQEDQQWRQQRQTLRHQAAQLPLVTCWIAILVITDNCTRQCLGLPLFMAGSRVTAEMVVAALRFLLPPELQFLISDRGTHFTATAFQQLAQEEDFIHVLIARHRPQSNGIAERFVRTLKEGLANKSWSCAAQLEQLITEFIAQYNNRPHQGLPIPGLSPNEFANRIWLM
jgi:transposase InsO family protein